MPILLGNSLVLIPDLMEIKNYFLPMKQVKKYQIKKIHEEMNLRHEVWNPLKKGVFFNGNGISNTSIDPFPTRAFECGRTSFHIQQGLFRGFLFKEFFKNGTMIGCSLELPVGQNLIQDALVKQRRSKLFTMLENSHGLIPGIFFFKK